MSTPSYENVERRLSAAEWMERYAAWLEASVSFLDDVAIGLDGAADRAQDSPQETFVAGEANGIRRMLAGSLRGDARAFADLWRRVTLADVRGRLAADEMDALHLLEDGGWSWVDGRWMNEDTPLRVEEQDALPALSRVMPVMGDEWRASAREVLEVATRDLALLGRVDELVRLDSFIIPVTRRGEVTA